MSSGFVQSARAQILQHADTGLKLRIRGGGSKDRLGRLVPCAVLETTLYSGIISYQPDELFITAKARTPLKEIEAALAEAGQCLPFEPPHFGSSATYGGLVASGLAGPGRVATGSVRDYLLGVYMLDGQGRSLRFGGTVIKNVAGYDVSRVLAGSWGTLGLILEATFKVMPFPVRSVTLFVDVESSQAIDWVNEWAGQPWPLNASAYLGTSHGGRLYLRFTGGDAAMDRVIQSFSSRYGMQELDPKAAYGFWLGLKEQEAVISDCFSQGAPLWRFSLPSTARPLELPGDTVIEWHGAERWWRGEVDRQQLEAMAMERGGYLSLFRPSEVLEGDYGVQTHRFNEHVLAALEDRIRRSFDPHGTFAPRRLL